MQMATFVSLTADGDDAKAVIEGIVLANYQFLTYKTGDKNKPNKLSKLNVLANDVSEDDLKELTAVATWNVCCS